MSSFSCVRCGRSIGDPTSVGLGMGPVCARKAGILPVAHKVPRAPRASRASEAVRSDEQGDLFVDDLKAIRLRSRMKALTSRINALVGLGAMKDEQADL